MGAVGISCGLEYVPGSYAPEAEIAELCKAVARHNGLFAIHMRNEDDRVELSLARGNKNCPLFRSQVAGLTSKGPECSKLAQGTHAAQNDRGCKVFRC